MEGGFQRLQHWAVTRDSAERIGGIVAIAIGVPHRIRIGGRAGAREFPSHLVSIRGLHRADRHPGPPLARRDWRTLVFKLGTVSGAGVLKKIIIASLDQAGQSIGLDQNGGPRWKTDHPIAV